LKSTNLSLLINSKRFEKILKLKLYFIVSVEKPSINRILAIGIDRYVGNFLRPSADDNLA